MPQKTQTISLAIYSAIQTGDQATALKLSAVALVIAIISLIIYNILLKKDKRNSRDHE